MKSKEVSWDIYFLVTGYELPVDLGAGLDSPRGLARRQGLLLIGGSEDVGSFLEQDSGLGLKHCAIYLFYIYHMLWCLDVLNLSQG